MQVLCVDCEDFRELNSCDDHWWASDDAWKETKVRNSMTFWGILQLFNYFLGSWKCSGSSWTLKHPFSISSQGTSSLQTSNSSIFTNQYPITRRKSFSFMKSTTQTSSSSLRIVITFSWKLCSIKSERIRRELWTGIDMLWLYQGSTKSSFMSSFWEFVIIFCSFLWINFNDLGFFY